MEQQQQQPQQQQQRHLLDVVSDEEVRKGSRLDEVVAAGAVDQMLEVDSGFKQKPNDDI